MAKKLISFSNVTKKEIRLFFLVFKLRVYACPIPARTRATALIQGRGPSSATVARRSQDHCVINPWVSVSVSYVTESVCIRFLLTKKTCYYFLFNFFSTEVSDPCSSRPCLNSGICSSVGTSQFKCFCSPGYTGTHCEHAQGPLFHITESFKN